MVPLILFIVFMLLTLTVGCFVVGTVIVEARRDGRPMLPEDPRPEPVVAPAEAAPLPDVADVATGSLAGSPARA